MKKKLLTSISLLLISVIATYGQENKIIENFQGKEIHGLIINGAFDVQLSQGKETGVSIQVREDLVPKLEISITENNYVIISFGDDVTKYFQGKKKPLAKIVVSRLDQLHISGSVSLIAKGSFTSKDAFDLKMSGGAFADFLKVNCEKAHLEFKGNSKIDDSEFNAETEVEMVAGESASPSVKINCQTLRLSCGATSKVNLSGKGNESARVHVTGTSKTTMVNFISPKITAVVSDMSRLNANVTGEVDLTKSGTAAFRYIGNGKIIGEGAKPL